MNQSIVEKEPLHILSLSFECNGLRNNSFDRIIIKVHDESLPSLQKLAEQTLVEHGIDPSANDLKEKLIQQLVEGVHFSKLMKEERMAAELRRLNNRASSRLEDKRNDPYEIDTR